MQQCFASTVMIKIFKLNFLFVTFFMPECGGVNPGLIIIHLDESEETAEGSENRQIVGPNKG